MKERQPRRVQRLTREFDGRLVELVIHVALLAHKGVSPKAGLNANLVALPRDQAHLDERGPVEELQHPILADRLRATRIALGGLLLDERVTIPDQPIAPGTALRRGMA